MLEIKDEVTLNNGKQYLVTSKAIYKHQTYYLLTELKNIRNIMICKETNRQTLEEVTEEKLISTLSLMFTKESLETIKSDLDEL